MMSRLIGLVSLVAFPAAAEWLPMQPCPSSPNCVSSFATDEEHQVEAFVFEGPAQAAWERLQAVVAQMPRTKIISVTEDYLHAEFKSKLFRFVDDVEFQLDASAQRIHVRSASRTGRSDFGVNRKRVEAIRALLSAARTGTT